jgi:hypothetical protein
VGLPNDANQPSSPTGRRRRGPRPDDKSPVSREAHAGICESRGVRLPRPLDLPVRGAVRLATSEVKGPAGIETTSTSRAFAFTRAAAFAGDRFPHHFAVRDRRRGTESDCTGDDLRSPVVRMNVCSDRCDSLARRARSTSPR